MVQIPSSNAQYRLFGPFTLDLSLGFNEALEQLFSTTDKGLSDAVGVYVWTQRVRDKYLPWNVGLTNKGFRKRFNSKAEAFLNFSMKARAKKTDVFLLALMKKKGGFRVPKKGTRKIPSNEWLETMLIGASIAVNPNLSNKANLNF